MQFRLDQLGKSILRDFFVLVGSAETELEVPPGDAQRIDLWHVPDPALLRAHPEIEPGVLRSMAEEAGAVEIFSNAPGEPAFLAVVRKRHEWHHALELRTERAQPLVWLWLVCAGRPDGILDEYGFVPDAAAPPGVYVTRPAAWRVRVVVIGELPRVRTTILLRLLGTTFVRRAAQRDLAALPKDAWETRLAVPWLVRLSFEIPIQGLVAEERELIMETREWFEQWHRKNVDEPLQRAVQHAEQKAEQKVAQAEQNANLRTTIQLFEMRLGRVLADAEEATLAERLRALGQRRLNEVVLRLSAIAAAEWLADPDAR